MEEIIAQPLLRNQRKSGKKTAAANKATTGTAKKRTAAQANATKATKKQRNTTGRTLDHDDVGLAAIEQWDKENTGIHGGKAMGNAGINEDKENSVYSENIEYIPEENMSPQAPIKAKAKRGRPPTKKTTSNSMPIKSKTDRSTKVVAPSTTEAPLSMTRVDGALIEDDCGFQFVRKSKIKPTTTTIPTEANLPPSERQEVRLMIRS